MVYNTGFFLFQYLLLPLLYLFIPKARRTIRAQRGIWERYAAHVLLITRKKRVLWFHVASAGEYLLARPIIEKCSKKYHCIVTVTSVSGYNWLLKEKNPAILFFDYIPLDTRKNSVRIVDLISPDALIVVKNDLWLNTIDYAFKKEIPLFLFSISISRDNIRIKNRFVRGLYRHTLNYFSEITVVNEESFAEVKKLVHMECVVTTSGDIKFDSVLERKKKGKQTLVSIPFKKESTLVLGSLWNADLDLLLSAVTSLMEKHKSLKVIVAPHEMDEKIISLIEKKWKKFGVVKFSDLLSRRSKITGMQKVLIVDTTGNLFHMYDYGSISFVGGGFGTGIHNILEPAVMQNVVCFGPNHKKFPEAQNMIHAGVGFEISSGEQFYNLVESYFAQGKRLSADGKKALQFVVSHAGSLDTHCKIIDGKFSRFSF